VGACVGGCCGWWGQTRIADGRVYVVRHPIHTDADQGRQVRGELLVLDADSGRLLHTLRLAAMTVSKYGDSAILDVRDIADGTVTVTVGWRNEGPDLLVITA